MIYCYCKKCKQNFIPNGLTGADSTCPFCSERSEAHSQLFWCSHCNIPIYDSVCPICGTVGAKFTADARPVFPEERLLVEIILNKPLAFIKDSVWNGTGNRYYVNGKRIAFSVSDINKLDADEIRLKLKKFTTENSYESFNSMIRTWIEANAERYHHINDEARAYICEKVAKFENDNTCSMFVSFSGGKDSTVVSDLVRKALGKSSIIHIFGDTTLEFSETYDYLQRFKANNLRTPILHIKNDKQDFYNLCETFGPPSRSLRWCCTIFKTGVIGEKIKRTFDGNKTILTFYGIRRNESTSRNLYERSSKGKKILKQLVSSPIIDWFDYDIWLYLMTTNIDFNRAYRLGYTRVGCWCCPNNTAYAQFLSRIYMPEQSQRFETMLIEFAKKMKKNDPEEYVRNGGWKARQGGAGIESSKNVAVSFKPCATDTKSFNYILNKPITLDLYDFFKPFGILDFDVGKSQLGEVYIFDYRTNQPIIKLQGRIGSNELRISILRTPIAGRSKILEIELKFKCQITKYQVCVGCHACENVCKHNAIKLIKSGPSDTDYRYEIDEKKCVHCFECINYYSGGCYMRRVLLPRGKGYIKK